MAQTVCVLVNAEEVVRLEAIVADRNRPLKHVQRARIILASVERSPVLEVAQRTGASRPAVWRWQARYAEAGVDGLLRDKTRPARQGAVEHGEGGQGAGADVLGAARRGGPTGLVARWPRPWACR